MPEQEQGDFVTEGLPEEPIEAGPAPNPIYSRQSTLGLQAPTVILVGAGGVGCWVALALVLGGVERMAIFDGDSLDTHNLNRFPLGPEKVGEPKSAALASWLRSLRPGADIVARGEFDPELHPDCVADWLVCATDSLRSRKMCYDFATMPTPDRLAMNYLEVGADGESWTLSPAPPEFSTELEDQPGYQTVPVHVGPCMMAGAAAAYYILHNSRPMDSHCGKWDGQRVAISTMSEDTSPTVYCQYCGTFRVPRVSGLIPLIKHLREVHNPLGIGLAEAKAEVQRWFDAQAQVHVSEVGEWTPEQVASHDEYLGGDGDVVIPDNEEVEDGQEV